MLHQAALGELAEKGRLSDTLAAALAARAKTDWDTNIAARELVSKSAIEGWPLPVPLHDFAKSVVNQATPPSKKGDTGWKLRHRNQLGAFILQVLTLRQGFGMTPSKNPTQTELCAFDMLVAATEGLSWASISKSQADEIWRNRKRLLAEFEIRSFMSVLAYQGKHLSTEVALNALSELDAIPSGRKKKKEPDAKPD